MKKYEELGKDPLKLAEYIAEKLNIAVQTICQKTGTRFYHSDAEYKAIKGIILTELLEDTNNEEN